MFPPVGGEIYSLKDWVKIPFPFWPRATVYPQALAYVMGCIEWSSSYFPPKSNLLIHLELCLGDECDNFNIVCFSIPTSIICNEKSDAKEWSGKDCVS